MGTWIENLRGRSLAARGTILAVVVLALFALVGPVGWAISHTAGVLAAAAAAGLCLVGA
ncbi:hypothetical protein LCGC14_2909710, partial [marine sediment metagenome]